MTARISPILWSASALVLVCACSAADDLATWNHCRTNSVSVTGEVRSSALYVDRPYVRILVKPHDEAYYLYDIVTYMLANGYSALETTNQGPGDLMPLSGRHAAPPGRSVVRISVKPLGDPACDAYKYVSEYPAQAWPWLRSLGVQVNECIGLERISPDERSNLRILVDEQLLTKRATGDWGRVRMDVRVVDASTAPERVVARMTEHYEKRGGGKAGISYHFPCKEGDQQVKALSRAFASNEGRGKRPEVVDVDTTIQPSDAVPISDDELKAFTWVVQPEKVWAHNIVNPEGTAWISRPPSRDAATDRFNVFLGDRIVSAKVPRPPEKGSWDVTGLARTGAGWAVIGGMKLGGPGSKPYLVQFDTMGALVRLAALTERQYATIAGAK